MQSPVSALVMKTMVFVALWCGLSSTAAAQSALTGIVHDPSLRVAVNAKVLVTDANTGKALPLTWTTTIGYYEIELPPGDYRIHIEQNGLSYDGVVRVYMNEKAALDITLEYRTADQLTVPAIAPAESAETTTNQARLGATFNRDAIDASPLSNGRTLQSFQSVVPGVVPTESVGTLAQFTADGQRRYTNRLTIDGVSGDLAIDTRNIGIGESGSGSLPAVSTLGGTQTIVPLAAIDEIEVKTTNATAQDARAPGAQTIVVTRSGGDRFRGDTFVDWRPEHLGAADWFANNDYSSRAPANSQTGGVSAGGPLIPQRVFYFGAWERQRVARPISERLEVPSLATRDNASDVLKPLLDSFAVPNGPETSNGLARLSVDLPQTSSLSTFSLRVDASLSSRHRLFGRMNVGSSEGDWVNNQQIFAGSYADEESANTNTGTIGLSSTFSRITNDLRGNVSTSRGSRTAYPSSLVDTGPLPLTLLLPPGSSQSSLSAGGDAFVNVFPTFVVGGTIQAGRMNANAQTQLQVSDVVTVNAGRHDWRFGVDARWAAVTTNPPANSYTYRFSTLTNLLRGQAFSLVAVRQQQARAIFTTVAAFAEDTFRVSKRLSLNYGVRYTVEPAAISGNETQPLLIDLETLPKTVTMLPSGTRLWNTSWGDVAPRLGATYQFLPGSGYATTVRSGFGVAFDSLNSVGANAYGGGYPYVSTRFLQAPVVPIPDSVWNAPAPAPFATGDRNAYYAFPKDFRSPRTYSWQLGIDQSLGYSQRLSVAYAGAAGRDLPYWYLYNFSLVRVNAFSNAGTSDYNALLVDYSRPLTRGVKVHVNYTWSHALDLDSGELVAANPAPEYIDPLSNRGSSDFDRRHVLGAEITYELPEVGTTGLFHAVSSGWQVATVIAYQTGAPLTITSSRSIGYGNFAFRPDAVPGFPVWISDPSVPGGQRINADAFTTPTDPRAGTLGRNTLQSSPLRQLDLSLSRSFHFSDRVVARLRIDAFNVFNIPNFGPPVTEMANQDGFGVPNLSYAAALGTGTLAGGGLVPLQQLGGPRSLQIGLRLAF